MNKKTLTNLLSLVAIVVALCLCSCGKSADKDDDDEDEETTEYSGRTVRKLLDKFDAGEMTDDDWEEAIDQVEAAFKQVESEAKDALEHSSSYEEFTDRMISFTEKYETDGVPELADILGELNQVPEDQISRRGCERFTKRFVNIREKFEDRCEKFDEDAKKRFGISDYAADTCAPATEVAAPAVDYYEPTADSAYAAY